MKANSVSITACQRLVPHPCRPKGTRCFGEYRARQRKAGLGFTLVEVIVVLVILAILAALLIPAMTGWIDKAGEKSAILECRQVVLAAQGTASEAYGLTNGTMGSDAMMSEPYISQIRILSEAPGAIGSIVTGNRAQVVYVEYTSLKGILVVYDITKDPVYQTSANTSNNASAIAAAADRLLQDLMNSPNWDALSRDKQSQALQDALLALYNGAYPALTAEYRQLLADKGLASTDNLNWRPILSQDGQLLLAASDADTSKRNPNSVLIYYNGSFYYHPHSYSGKASSANVSDQSFDVGNLHDTLPPGYDSLPQAEKNKVWVKV